MKKVTIHPITRIEGHLKVEAMVDNGIVKDANMSGTLFRGIENILEGRDPRDAVMISQRICGVCPEPHAIASVGAVDDAAGIKDKIPYNGTLIRNIIEATRTIADHILHFYILSGLDYIDPTKALEYEGDNQNLATLKQFLQKGYSSPFLPRDDIDFKFDTETTNEITAHYLKAIEIYRKAQSAASIFGGKWPHDSAIVAGGVSERLSIDKITAYQWRLEEIYNFVKNSYLPDAIALAKTFSDYLEIGKGCQNLLSYGGYKMKQNGELDTLISQGLVEDIDKYDKFDIDKITEDITNSFYNSDTPILHPSEGITEADANKENAYSWIKSPRYDKKVFETGPLAALLTTYLSKNNKTINSLVDKTLSEVGIKIPKLYSVAGRHLARALMANIYCVYLQKWAQELDPQEPVATEYIKPKEGQGIGVTEAPRGSLGHWLKVENGRIANYQVITPTAWNASPKDKDGNPGPFEQALIGLEVSESKTPIEILRVIRSFDPCTACAVHLISPKGNIMGKYKVV